MHQCMHAFSTLLKSSFIRLYCARLHSNGNSVPFSSGDPSVPGCKRLAGEEAAILASLFDAADCPKGSTEPGQI